MQIHLRGLARKTAFKRVLDHYSFHDRIFRPIVNSSGAYFFHFLRQLIGPIFCLIREEDLGPPLIIATFWKYLLCRW